MSDALMTRPAPVKKAPAHDDESAVRPLRILMISTYFRPDVASTGVLMTHLAEDLVKFGHHVRVLTSMPHYTAELEKSAAPGRESWRGADVTRMRVYSADNRASFAQRLLNYFTYNAQASLRGVLAGRYDVAFIPSPPLTNGLVGDVLRRLRGTPFIYNVQDIWPDVLFRAGIDANSRVADSLRRMERYVYRRAAAMAVISDGFRENLLQKNVPDHKINVIPNFFDTEHVQPGPRDNAFSRAHGLNDRFVALFAGNIGHSQGLESVLDAAEQLQQQSPRVVFLIVGDGASKASLVARASERNLQNVRFLPFQPHETLPDLYATADVCLVPLKHGFTNESVPCKVFTIMASGRAMIAAVDEGSDTWQLVQRSHCGTTIAPESGTDLAQEIARLSAQPNELTEMGAHGREHVLQHYTRVAIARKYEALLQRVAAGKANG